MCEFCEGEKTIVSLAQIHRTKIEVKTYIIKGSKTKTGYCPYSIATELNNDGWGLNNTRPIKFCPMCGRKLSEASE